MRLYYMTKAEYGLLSIKNKRLKVSTVAELNDPFELLGASLNEKEMRQALNILHKHWRNNLGMLCLTDNWRSPVMWAHYADKHYGMCLGFDVVNNASLIKPVSYVPDRLKGSLIAEDGQGFAPDSAELLEAILTTKYKDWSYEREQRLFVDLDTKDADGFYYYDFNNQLVLREVILGARCKLRLREVADEVKSPTRTVEVYKARAAFKSFDIVRQKEDAAIMVET